MNGGVRVEIQKHFLLGLLIGVIPSMACAQEAVKLNMSDVYFQWKPMPKGSAMCGYAILGNHLSRVDPKIEWDINIDELVQGDVRVVGVSAGTFVVKGKTRTPRAAITELAFTTEDDSQPLTVELIGTPNQDNGVRGTLPLAPAAQLFSALTNNRQIEARIKYFDGTSELLRFAGFRDHSKFSGDNNGPFGQCLRGITPRIIHPRPTP
jgi:hypothetical protein